MHAQQAPRWGVGLNSGIHVFKFVGKSKQQAGVSPEYITPVLVSSVGYSANLLLSRFHGRWEFQSGLGYFQLQSQTVADYAKANWAAFSPCFPQGSPVLICRQITTDRYVEMPLKINYLLLAAQRIGLMMGCGISAYYNLGTSIWSHTRLSDGGISENSVDLSRDPGKSVCRFASHVSLGANFRWQKNYFLRLEPAIHYRSLLATAGYELNTSATFSVIRHF
jgi:hypothetical protein